MQRRRDQHRAEKRETAQSHQIQSLCCEVPGEESRGVSSQHNQLHGVNEVDRSSTIVHGGGVPWCSSPPPFVTGSAVAAGVRVLVPVRDFPSISIWHAISPLPEMTPAVSDLTSTAGAPPFSKIAWYLSHSRGFSPGPPDICRAALRVCRNFPPCPDPRWAAGLRRKSDTSRFIPS